MPELDDPRVAVYIDFDNIVISRYDQVHGRGAYMRDKPRLPRNGLDDDFAEKLRLARVDLGAVLDYASSFGTLVLTRAYADWSASVNAEYRGQLVGRAVDLVQLFPAAAYGKNGADIRLAVDTVEDMFRLPDLTHVVIVAGDSDYIALAQRCKRLGRYVVGVGVAGSTSRSLAAACDELAVYDTLPGVEAIEPAPPVEQPQRRRGGGQGADPAPEPSDAEPVVEPETADAASPADPEPVAPESDADAPRVRRTGRRAKAPVRAPDDEVDDEPVDPQQDATRLLSRALELGHDKADADWLHSGNVKTQMRRMDPSFSERSLGFRSFSDFIRSRPELAELDESGTARLVRKKSEEQRGQ